jgi:hypothetical protein
MMSTIPKKTKHKSLRCPHCHGTKFEVTVQTYFLEEVGDVLSLEDSPEPLTLRRRKCNTCGFIGFTAEDWLAPQVAKKIFKLP